MNFWNVRYGIDTWVFLGKARDFLRKTMFGMYGFGYSSFFFLCGMVIIKKAMRYTCTYLTLFFFLWLGDGGCFIVRKKGDKCFFLDICLRSNGRFNNKKMNIWCDIYTYFLLHDRFSSNVCVCVCDFFKNRLFSFSIKSCSSCGRPVFLEYWSN